MVKSLGDAPYDHCLATGHDMQSWTSRSQKRTHQKVEATHQALLQHHSVCQARISKTGSLFSNKCHLEVDDGNRATEYASHKGEGRKLTTRS
jgi:hypothetical protein